MYRVLIIDDDKLARKGLMCLVDWERYGLTVVGDVANGMQALEFLEKNQVDLAFVDLSMPVLSGMDFIQESKKMYPDMQYVILTFHEEFEEVQYALRLGVLDYISKLRLEEMNNEEVFRRIGVLMERAGREGEPFMTEEREKKRADDQGVSFEKMEELRRVWTEGRWIYSDRAFRELLRELDELPITARQSERLLMWVEQKLEEEFAFSYPVPYLECPGQGNAWLRECRRELYGHVKGSGRSGSVQSCILLAVLYCAEHLGDRLNAELVAGRVNMSRSYFSVNFKAVTGITFNDFLKERRIGQACAILARENVRTAELAERVGYEDAKYFSRLFSQETGMNCSEYAKQFSRCNCTYSTIES